MPAAGPVRRWAHRVAGNPNEDGSRSPATPRSAAARGSATSPHHRRVAPLTSRNFCEKAARVPGGGGAETCVPAGGGQRRAHGRPGSRRVCDRSHGALRSVLIRCVCLCASRRDVSEVRLQAGQSDNAGHTGCWGSARGRHLLKRNCSPQPLGLRRGLPARG